MIFNYIFENSDRVIITAFNNRLARGRNIRRTTANRNNVPITVSTFVPYTEIGRKNANLIVNEYVVPLVESLADVLNSHQEMKRATSVDLPEGDRVQSKSYNTDIQFRLTVVDDPVGQETGEFLYYDDGSPRLEDKEDPRTGRREHMKERIPGFTLYADAFLSE